MLRTFSGWDYVSFCGTVELLQMNVEISVEGGRPGNAVIGATLFGFGDGAF